MPEQIPTAIEIFDARLRPVVAGAPQLERLCTGARWSEGPVWMAEDDSVLWSDIPNDRMLRWSAADGMRVWRESILAVLYRKRIHTLHQPGMNIREMEDLLGIPKEHLEFSLWYLKERGAIKPGDNGRYAITVAGVDKNEA